MGSVTFVGEERPSGGSRTSEMSGLSYRSPCFLVWSSISPGTYLAEKFHVAVQYVLYLKHCLC